MKNGIPRGSKVRPNSIKHCLGVYSSFSTSYCHFFTRFCFEVNSATAEYDKVLLSGLDQHIQHKNFDLQTSIYLWQENVKIESVERELYCNIMYVMLFGV